MAKHFFHTASQFELPFSIGKGRLVQMDCVKLSKIENSLTGRILHVH